MSKRGFFALVLAVLASIWPVGCNKAERPFECRDAIGCVTIGPGEPVEIGVIQDLSGGAGAYGIEQVETIKLVVAGRGNQLLGHRIELQIEDEGCLPEGGKIAALKLASQPQMVAIIGTTCSGAGAAAAKVMSEAGLVMISGVNSATSLTSMGGKPGRDWQPGYFRTTVSNTERGKAAAIWAFGELGVRKAATINQGDPYTKGLTEVFEQEFTVLGGEVVLAAGINKGDTDMQPVLTAVADSGAELLFFQVYRPEGDYIVQQAEEMKGSVFREEVVLMSSGTLTTDEFVKSVGADGIGMYFIGRAPLEGLAHDRLISEYESRYGESPPATGYAYAWDATNMLLDTIEKVAVQDANAEGRLHIGRQALREAMYKITDFEGITGKLTCDEFGDCGRAKFNIMRLDDPAAGLEGLRSNVVYTYRPGE